MGEFNIQESIKAQADYCIREGAPHFAPESGRCWSCNQNIYQSKEKVYQYGTPRVTVTGITTEKATNQLVTGCPHCNRSYCD